MSDTEKKCANDKPEISEEDLIFTSHRLGLAPATFGYTVPPRANMGWVSR